MFASPEQCTAPVSWWKSAGGVLCPPVVRSCWWVGVLWGLSWLLLVPAVPWYVAVPLAAKTVIPIVVVRFAFGNRSKACI